MLISASALTQSQNPLLGSQPGPNHGPPPGWHHGPDEPVVLASSQELKAGGATIQLDIGQGALDVSQAEIVTWVQRAAQAVVIYYGRFPVARYRVLVIPAADRRGVMGGTTWGHIGGFPAFTRIRLGQHVSAAALNSDWTMTHEMVHTAFPNQEDDQSWMEEGLATYVEPVARVQAGQLSAQRIWADMASDMPKGEPAAGDSGLDHTHTWGRTYWGGALFCLAAEVAIRKQTGNRKGLQDALRAIVAAGGTIDKEWPLGRTLAIGDKATGTTVLVDQYRKWSGAPMPMDLAAVWAELGIHAGPQGATLDPAAPMAAAREAITTPRP